MKNNLKILQDFTIKKDLKNLYTGLLFGLFLFFVGAIDFQNYISYPVIISVFILIIFPMYNIFKSIILRYIIKSSKV